MVSKCFSWGFSQDVKSGCGTLCEDGPITCCWWEASSSHRVPPQPWMSPWKLTAYSKNELSNRHSKEEAAVPFMNYSLKSHTITFAFILLRLHQQVQPTLKGRELGSTFWSKKHQKSFNIFYNDHRVFPLFLIFKFVYDWNDMFLKYSVGFICKTTGTWYFLCKLPRWLRGKESICQCRTWWFNPWVGKIPCRRKWQPTPIFLPGKFHGQSLTGYSTWGHKESDMI